MIRNIILDMGNVLIHWCPERFVERYGLSEEDRALVLQEVFTSVEWIQLDRGIISFEEGIGAMCRRLPERLHTAARELTLDWWRDCLFPVEGMGELVRELKGLGYGIYLLSNAKADLPLYFDRIPGSECFDGRIVSADWKLLKVEAALLVGMSGTIFRGAKELRRALIEAGVPVKA